MSDQFINLDEIEAKEKTRRERVNEAARKRYAANPQKKLDKCRRYRAENAEEVHERDRQRRKHPSRRKQLNEDAKRRRAENPEKYREEQLRYRKANREARNAQQRQRYADSWEKAEKAREACRRYRAENLKKENERRRKHSANHPEQERRSRWLWQLKKYGLTEADYDAILASQGSGCRICKTARLPAGYKLALDHCHATGKIRGILCSNCNMALGMMRDSPELLRAAAEYLETFQYRDAPSLPGKALPLASGAVAAVAETVGTRAGGYHQRAPREDHVMPTGPCILSGCGKPIYCRGLCPTHYQRWKRQGSPGPLAKWVAAGGKLMRPCVICGTPHWADRGKTYCSEECRLEKHRRAYHALPPEKKQTMFRRHNANAKRRRREKPEQSQATDRRKWERTKADPAKHAAARQKAKEYYAKHADVIQARRKARFLSLTDVEFLDLLKRQRAYSRKWRSQERADPQRGARRKAYEDEYRRRQREAKAVTDMARLTLLLTARTRDAVKAKPCIICGKPVVGKVRGAKTCSPECVAKRHSQLVHPPRPRPCKGCGQEFADPTSAKYCADCRKKTPLPESVACEWCGEQFPPVVHGQRGCCRAHSREIYKRDKREAARGRALPQRPCIVCSTPFPPERHNAKTCSVECRAEYHRRTERARSQQKRRSRDQEPGIDHSGNEQHPVDP